jgi:branched-chain amino acid aminotransferase
MAIYYVNGAYVAEDDAQLSVRDLAVLRGYGAFDYLRTYKGEPFRLMQNVARLRNSCAVIGLELPWSDEEIASIVRETIAHNNADDAHRHDEYNIRIVVTGGISPNNITPQAGEAGLLVMVTPLHPLPEAWYSEGAIVATVETQRVFPTSKSTNYISAIVAQREAQRIGGIEALYMDTAGNVSEGTTSNVFAFYGNTLVTPPLDGAILPGRTRATILEIASEHYTIEERTLNREELYRADEVFISAANKRVVPIVQVDDVKISPAPGELTRHIMELFDALTWDTE